MPDHHREIVTSRSERREPGGNRSKAELYARTSTTDSEKVTEELIGAQEYYAPELPNQILEGVYGRSAVTEVELGMITGLEQTLPRDMLSTVWG